MVRKRLREEKTFKNEFDRLNALIEMWHLFPGFLVRMPICWQYMPRSPDATILILALDLEPGGLTRTTFWHTFFRSRKVKDADTNLLFESWRHAHKSSPVTLPKKDQKSSKVVHQGLAYTTTYWGSRSSNKFWHILLGQLRQNVWYHHLDGLIEGWDMSWMPNKCRGNETLRYQRISGSVSNEKRIGYLGKL